jgi:general secretion pathway protein B
MSFILDALRKSENERRRSAVPGISQIPLAARRATVPSWAIAVIVLLAATVLGLGIAWWESSRFSAPGDAIHPPLQTDSRAAASEPLGLPSPSAAPVTTRSSAPLPPLVPATTVAASSEVATTPAGDTASAKTAPARIAQPHDGATAVSSDEARPVPPPAVAATADASANEPPLPSPEALAAEGIVVPPLRLELHAYSNRPTERYVFINGSKYVEGDRLAEGPQVITIVPSGVVLSAQGRRFLLSPE